MGQLGMLPRRRVDELVGHAVYVGFPQLAMPCTLVSHSWHALVGWIAVLFLTVVSEILAI